MLDTVALAGFGIGGLGYDLATNTLWGATTSFPTVYQLDLDGNVLDSFNAGVNFHDGLEIGEIETSTTNTTSTSGGVPEPASLFLLGIGVTAYASRRRQKKSSAS